MPDDIFDFYEIGIEAAEAFAVIQGIYGLVVALIGIAAYVAQGLSFYTIAKRRGIRHAWLSWIPLGSVWILGCISDQYHYVVNHQVKSKRKAMLTLSVLTVVTYIILIVALVFMILGLAGGIVDSSASWGGWDGDWEALEPSVGVVRPGLDIANGSFFGGLIAMVLSALVMSGLAIALTVLEYVCLYDLYRSCEPNNAVVYLLLSIFVGVCLPILLLVCRNKDLGMPPRKQPSPPPRLEDPEPWRDEE